MNRFLPLRSRARARRVPVRLQLVSLEDRTLMSVDLWATAVGPTTSAQPPDSTGAAGPDYVVEAINLTTSWYDRNTFAPFLNRTLNALFTQAGLTGVQSLSDPVAMYDEFTGQFVIGALDYSLSGTTHTSRFDLAISYDEDPRDGFYGARYNMDDGVGGFDFADYPKAGYNQEAYVFTFNMFVGGSSYNHVNALAVDKSTLDGYRTAVPGGSSHFTLAPSVMHNANPGDPMWLIEAAGGSRVNVVQMTDILSPTPTFRTFNVAVPGYSSEPKPWQPGDTTTGSVASFDTRILNAAYNNGLLVAGHTIGSGGLSQARWYEIDLVDYGTPTLVQEGNVNQGPGVYTYFPSLDVNDEGDIGMTFMESSANEYLSMYVAGQSIYNADYGTGVMETPALALAGTARYTSSRIGDYSMTTRDPADGYGFWAFNQYGRTNGSTGLGYFWVDPDYTGDSGNSGDSGPARAAGRRVLPPLAVGVEDPTGSTVVGKPVRSFQEFVTVAVAAPVTPAAPAPLAAGSEQVPTQAPVLLPRGQEEAGRAVGQEASSEDPGRVAAVPLPEIGPDLLGRDLLFERALDL